MRNRLPVPVSFQTYRLLVPFRTVPLMNSLVSFALSMSDSSASLVCNGKKT